MTTPKTPLVARMGRLAGDEATADAVVAEALTDAATVTALDWVGAGEEFLLAAAYAQGIVDYARYLRTGDLTEQLSALLNSGGVS